MATRFRKRSNRAGKRKTKDDGTPVATSRVVNNVVRVHVVAHRAHSLPSTQWLGKQAPYVVATLLPFQWAQRTKACPSGGSSPEWGLQQDNHMFFEPKEGSLGQLTLRMELWNSKGGNNDTPIAFTHIEIPEIPITSTPEEHAYRLQDVRGKPGGMLICTVHIEGIKGGKKKQFATIKDHIESGGKEAGSKSNEGGGTRANERPTVPSDTSRKRLRIDIHSATGLKNVQTMGRQDPYAVAMVGW